MLWYIITKTSMFLSIFFIELQLAHVGSAPLELQSMVGMSQLHLTSTEMVLAVGLATRYIFMLWISKHDMTDICIFFQHSHGKYIAHASVCLMFPTILITSLGEVHQRSILLEQWSNGGYNGPGFKWSDWLCSEQTSLRSNGSNHWCSCLSASSWCGGYWV